LARSARGGGGVVFAFLSWGGAGCFSAQWFYIYINLDWNLDEKFEVISPQWKKDIREEILKEIKIKMNEKFEEVKKEYNTKFDISFSDEDIIDTGGHE
jgi:hypothetical protein